MPCRGSLRRRRLLGLLSIIVPERLLFGTELLPAVPIELRDSRRPVYGLRTDLFRSLCGWRLWLRNGSSVWPGSAMRPGRLRLRRDKLSHRLLRSHG